MNKDLRESFTFEFKLKVGPVYVLRVCCGSVKV